MSLRRKDPLRPLTGQERMVLTEIVRARSEPPNHVARAKMLLALAEGQTSQAAAEAAGRKSNGAMSELVSRYQAGFSWQRSRTWCETGKLKRKRKAGLVEVTDPDAEAKKLIEAAYTLGLAVW